MVRTKHLLLSLGLLALVLSGCTEEQDPIQPDLDLSKTNIQLHNVSQFDFQNVEVNTWNDPVFFSELKSGAKSEFREFEIAYRYAYVRLFINGNEFIIQPIDYVGETPLGPGRFTYVLDVVDFENRALSISTAVVN